MKTETRELVTTLEPLFYSLLRGAEHHNLDEVCISTSRAREIHTDLLILKKKLKETTPQTTPMTIDRHLDSIFNL